MRTAQTSASALALALSLAGILGIGCSVIVSPDPGRLGGDVDAGTGRPDAGRPDTGTPIDSGPPTCGPDLPRCEGDTLLFCLDGAVRERSCFSEGAYCGQAGGSPACVPWTCEPDSAVCAPGGRALRTCNSRGTSYTETDCDNGCADGACIPDAGACDAPPRLSPGVPQSIVTCGLGDSFRYQRGGECDSDYPGEDYTYEVRIVAAGTYTFEVIDRDSVAAVDTALYLRTACENVTTQVGCNDDLPCMESDFFPDCAGGATEYRQSRLVMDLEVGTYYLTVDTLEWRDGTRSYECGRVELEMTRGPAGGGLPFP